MMALNPVKKGKKGMSNQKVDKKTTERIANCEENDLTLPTSDLSKKKKALFYLVEERVNHNCFTRNFAAFKF